MHKIQIRCKNCKFLRGNHTFCYCGSRLSTSYMAQVYPQDDNCEVFYPGTKRKKINKKKPKNQEPDEDTKSEK